jgi:glucokinase
MPARVLAGDIGGTKTNLALYATAPGTAPVALRGASFDSRAFPSLEAVLARFLEPRDQPVAAAAFGLAGPVLGGIAQITNLPWRVESRVLADVIGCAHVRLLNDLETTAYGALVTAPERLEILNPGVPQGGNRAVIAAGTGLGQALLSWDGARHYVVATEGGHADFGPSTDEEVGLLEFLRGQFSRVSWERVLSGPGLHNIFRYLDEGLHRPVAAELRARLQREDPSAVIGTAGMDGGCPTCAEAVAMFIRLYGAQTGNLALTAMALGGVYVGGGIVTKLLPKVRAGSFVAAFVAKDPHRALMQRTPLWILLDPNTSLLGAAHAAVELIA